MSGREYRFTDPEHGDEWRVHVRDGVVRATITGIPDDWDTVKEDRAWWFLRGLEATENPNADSPPPTTADTGDET